MRSAFFAAFLLLSCRTSATPDAGLPHPVPAPHQPDQEPEAGPPSPGATGADAGPRTTLRALDAGAYPKAKSGGVLLCQTHKSEAKRS